MKKHLLTIALASLLLMAAAASAQNIHLRATVPFDFVVHGTSLPAGQYEIHSFGPNEKILAIRGVNSTVGILVLSDQSETTSPAVSSKLVFHRSGAQYVLTQLWLLGEQTGYQVAPSVPGTELSMDSRQSEVEVLLAQR